MVFFAIKIFVTGKTEKFVPIILKWLVKEKISESENFEV